MLCDLVPIVVCLGCEDFNTFHDTLPANNTLAAYNSVFLSQSVDRDYMEEASIISSMSSYEQEEEGSRAPSKYEDEYEPVRFPTEKF